MSTHKEKYQCPACGKVLACKKASSTHIPAVYMPFHKANGSRCPSSSRLHYGPILPAATT